MQFGAIAQMGERLHGMQEVVGSNPIGSILPVFLYFFIPGNKIDSIRLQQNDLDIRRRFNLTGLS